MNYQEVTVRFLHDNERLISSDEKEMPLVIEASDQSELSFLKKFLKNHSSDLRSDLAQYGAILLRGFQIKTDLEFEEVVESINGFQGIPDAFMSEEGRTHVGDLKYVLHTNSVYKTGGTLYLGGFHSENYYSPDVPGIICFFCRKPSLQGGETGLINTEKIFPNLNPELIKQLEAKPFFVAKWLLTDVCKRYHIERRTLESLAPKLGLSILGKGKNAFLCMHKPSIFEHAITQQKALQINFFEVLGLNEALRLQFMQDYSGKVWFWHRLVWRLPAKVLKLFEITYMVCASFSASPKTSLAVFKSKLKVWIAHRFTPKNPSPRVGSCFTKKDVLSLAQNMRRYYSSCLWKPGDILLVDNQKVIHAGMPGKGPRLIRALIAEPLNIPTTEQGRGVYACNFRKDEELTIAAQVNSFSNQ